MQKRTKIKIVLLVLFFVPFSCAAKDEIHYKSYFGRGFGKLIWMQIHLKEHKLLKSKLPRSEMYGYKTDKKEDTGIVIDYFYKETEKKLKQLRKAYPSQKIWVLGHESIQSFGEPVLTKGVKWHTVGTVSWYVERVFIIRAVKKDIKDNSSDGEVVPPPKEQSLIVE